MISCCFGGRRDTYLNGKLGWDQPSIDVALGDRMKEKGTQQMCLVRMYSTISELGKGRTEAFGSSAVIMSFDRLSMAILPKWRCGSEPLASLSHATPFCSHFIYLVLHRQTLLGDRQGEIRPSKYLGFRPLPFRLPNLPQAFYPPY